MEKTISQELNYINDSIIETSLKNIFNRNTKNNIIDNVKRLDNKICQINFKNIINKISNIEKLQNKCLDKGINKNNLKKILYMKKIFLWPNPIFKSLRIDLETILSFFIPFLKKDINNSNHKEIYIKFLILLKLEKKNIFPKNTFLLMVEIILIFFQNIRNSNRNPQFIDNEPYSCVNDIIESFINFSKEEEVNDIFLHLIDLFDKYLINYLYFKESSIWLKLLEYNEKIDNNHTRDKLYKFLINVYICNLKDEFLQEYIISKCITNINYFINLLKFLINFFDEEENIKASNDFRISNGFIIQKYNGIIVQNISLKINEFCLISSFKITKLEKNVNILNIYNEPDKPIINFTLDEDNFLLIISQDKVWETKIRIQENKSYLYCLEQKKKKKKKPKLCFYINEKGSRENIEIICEPKNFYYYKNEINSSIEFINEVNIELGKENFNGIIGETLIINKYLCKKDIQNVFKLREYYSKVIYGVNNNFENLNCIKPLNCNNTKFGTNKKDEILNKAINFFQKLGYEIKLEIMTWQDKAKYINNDLDYQKIGKMRYNKKYSIHSFYFNNGIELLTLQLHNIFSTVIDNSLINVYLSETLNFTNKLILFLGNEIIHEDENKFTELDKKISIFFLSLLNILSKAENFKFSSETVEVLMNLLFTFLSSQLYIQRNIILSILLDIRFYYNKNDIFQNPKLFQIIISELGKHRNNNKSIINIDILNKILLLDFAFLNKDNNHKTYKQILLLIITMENEETSNQNFSIINEIIDYTCQIKNEVKKYYFLKLIYKNLEQISGKLRSSIKFMKFLDIEKETINNEHCSYCALSQVLLYLLKEEIFLTSSRKKNYFFKFNSERIFTNPSLHFIKCIFIQCFHITNKYKFKFFKSKENGTEYITKLLDLAKNNTRFLNKTFEERMMMLVGNLYFIHKFEAMINYIIYLFNQQINSNHVTKLINESILLIINFIKLIYFSRLKTISIKREKNNNISEIDTFIYNLFSSKGMTILFYLYINFQSETALTDIKEISNKTIFEVYNPFYLSLLSMDLYYYNKININDNLKYYRFIYSEKANQQITRNTIKIIISNLIKNKISYNNDIILAQNNIKFLIFMYCRLAKGRLELNKEIEESICNYIKYIFDNNFISCRYSFEINPFLADNQNKKIERKFIVEIILDILFILYESHNFDSQFEEMIKNLFQNKIFSIDQQPFSKKKEDKEAVKFFKKKDFQNINKGVLVEGILFNIYLMFFFIIKSYIYKNNDNKNSDASKAFILVNQILSTLYNNVIQLYDKHNSKIKDIKNNELNKYFAEIYNAFKSFFSGNNKEKKFNLELFLNNHDSIFIKWINSMKEDKTNFYECLSINKYVEPSKKIEQTSKKFDASSLDELNLGERKSSSGNNNIHKNRTSNSNDSMGIGIEPRRMKNRPDSFYQKTLNINIHEIRIIKRKNSFERKLSVFHKNSNIILEPIYKTNFSQKEDEDLKLMEKMKKINISSSYYQNIISFHDVEILKSVVNPKNFYFWQKFTIPMKNYIFHQKNFEYLKKSFYLNHRTEKKKYYLNYPTKLKNYTTDEYYRPLLKVDTNFFNHKLINISHDYINEKILRKNDSEERILGKIKFTNLFPLNLYPSKDNKVVCELINNSGSIYGNIYFTDYFMIFMSDCQNDPRGLSDDIYTNAQIEEFFIFSYFWQERRKKNNKFILLFFQEIKEILIRRFCLTYIGYEIFTKDNKAFLFNFFNRKNLERFLSFFSEKLGNYLKIIDDKKSLQINISNKFLKCNINRKIDFLLVNDPIYFFEKSDFKNLYKKGMIQNFNYLLLLNKLSSRSYNDNYQYLVFPLLYMDIFFHKPRDLSKAICLSGDNNEMLISKIHFNYKQFKHHFSTHYSTSGYLFYYLVRLNPFTFDLIKLQDNKFDSPERMFHSLQNYLSIMNILGESRELIPELFFGYDFFLNLNHINLGYSKTKKEFVDDFYISEGIEIFDYFINLRKKLEKVDIIPWINNIFGYNQFDLENEEVINIFPLYSYIQYNNLEEKIEKGKEEGKEIKEIIKKTKEDIAYLSFGISPVQLFNSAHPIQYKENSPMNINDNSLEKISNFLNYYMNEFSQLIFLNNKNTGFEKRLIIKTKKIISIFPLNLYEDFNKDPMIKFELWKTKQIKIFPTSNIICEIFPNLFLICRYIDNIIQIKSETQSILFKCENMITSVVLFEKYDVKNTHVSKVLLGDEKGKLHLLKIEFEFNTKKKIFQVNKTIIRKEIKLHNSFIQGILFLKRLNLIFTYSAEGQVSIINAYSFDIINIIELGNSYYINSLKISNYDILYIGCFNRENKMNCIICYTLNGVKIMQFNTEKVINNFFVENKIIIVYEDNLIEVYNSHNFNKSPDNIIIPEEINSIENSDKTIIFCKYLSKEMKLMLIYKNCEISFQDIPIIED